MNVFTRLLTAASLALVLAACGGDAPRSAQPTEIADETVQDAPPDTDATSDESTEADVTAPQADDDAPFTLVMLGDSLTAGFGLENPDRLVNALAREVGAVDGRPIEIINAGVSGETSQDGLRRFDWSVPDNADGVLIELGANDMFQGRAPALVRADLDETIGRAQARGLWVGLIGMFAPANLGAQYQSDFNAIFSELSAERCAPLYPWYFQAMFNPEHGLDPGMLLADGVHPNAEGVDAVAADLGPWLARALAGGENPC